MHRLSLPLLLAIVVLLAACDGHRVVEPFVPSGNRIVLLEEFTGKGCTNCPKGSRELENLLAQFPNNLAVVSIHAGFFADPVFFPLGQYDFRTSEGEDLFSYLGPPLFYPAASVDRLVVNGDRLLGLNQWASVITQQIREEPAVDLLLETVFDTATRSLTVVVSGIGKAQVEGDIRISVMLTESGIIDAQDDAEADPNIVQDYVHKHVLRKMLTNARGDALDSSIRLGETFRRTYSISLPAEWVPEKMEVIAFVNIVNGADLSVLQAVHRRITE